MLRCLFRTVGCLASTLILAVFFHGQIHAADSSLYTLESGLSRLVYDASRSIVTVEAAKSLANEAVPDRDGVETLVSTGLLVDSGRFVLASAPMVAGGSFYQILFESRRISATLVGIDYFHEVALLKLSVPLGSSVRISGERSCAGRMVLALGDSYGVRAAPSLGFCAGSRPDGSMQFTMAMTSGTTGGGVFSLSGDLVGMISGSIGRDSRVVIALPAHHLPGIVEYLKSHGDRPAGYIGVTTQNIEISPPLEVMGHSSALVSVRARPVTRGTMIVSVAPGSPAALAGLRSGDILYAVDGDPIGSSLELSTFVRLQHPGKLLQFDVFRPGMRVSIPVRIGSKPLSSYHSKAERSQAGESSLQNDSLMRVVRFLQEEISRLERHITSPR